MNLIEAEITLNIYISVSLLILILVLLSSAVYAVWWKTSYIVPKYENRYFGNELFHEIFTKIGEVLVAQKKVRSWFCF